MQCPCAGGAPVKAGVGKSGNRRCAPAAAWRTPGTARDRAYRSGADVGPPSYAGMTEPEEESGMNKAERLWNLRDGALAWLYGLRVDGAAIAEAASSDSVKS